MGNDYVTGLHNKIRELKRTISHLNRSNAKKSERIKELEEEIDKLQSEIDHEYSKSQLVLKFANSVLSDIKKATKRKK